MPPKHRQKSSSEATRFEGIDNELLKLTFIETLSDSDVIKQLKRALIPQEIADKIDYLAAQSEQLKQTVKEKDEIIKALESRVDLLESAKDSIEQYPRRSNLRIEGIPESVGIGEIENAILDIVNDHMKLTPVLQSHEIERAHRIGRPKTDGGRPRTTIITLNSERRRDAIYRARINLKKHNTASGLNLRLFVNEDLTKTRSELLYELGKNELISDCWSFNRNILYKDTQGVVHQVRSKQDACVKVRRV